MTGLLVAVLAGCTSALVPHPRPRWPSPGSRPSHDSDPAAAVRRHRLPFAALAAVGGVSFVGQPWGWAAAVVVFAAVWWAAGRVEPPGVRRSREAARRQLPHVVRLLALALSAGAPVGLALRLVEEAFPGEATLVLRSARSQLELGMAPVAVWSEVAARSELAPLARALARAESLGAAPAGVLARLADDLEAVARADVEDRARAVGIRAAVPLGLCLLPAFLLLGVVPVVVAALSALRW